jgi:hypothetical protein
MSKRPVMQRRKVKHHSEQNHTREEEQEEEEEEEEEHIDCVCGVTGDTPGAQLYEGLWLQCDECLSWLHGACVGFPKRAPKGQKKKGKKDYTFRRQFVEKPSTILGCPGHQKVTIVCLSL